MKIAAMLSGSIDQPFPKEWNFRFLPPTLLDMAELPLGTVFDSNMRLCSRRKTVPSFLDATEN